MSAPDDRGALNDLVTRSAAGDVAAFEQLYRLMLPRVSALSRRLIVDVHEADDVSQDVMLEIWTKADRFDGTRGSAMSWLLAITHHRCVDRIRALEAARRRDSHWAVVAFTPDVDDSAALLLAADEAAALTTAVGQLSDRRREALAYAYFTDHSHAAASSMLGIPLGTFKSRVRDAVRALHATLSIDHAA